MLNSMENWKIIRLFLIINQSSDIIPATFSTSNIKEDSWKSSGKSLIEGSLSKELIMN